MSIDYTFTKETMETVEFLEYDRGQILDRAVTNVLGTEVALLTYAQILDGLPTEQSLLDSTDVCTRCKDHPVLAMKHNEICPGFVEKAREFRAKFDIAVLEFELKALDKFQNAENGSEEFKLRLIELTVVACHQIGAYLFGLDDGAHKHDLYNNWREMAMEERRNGVESRKYASITPTAFSHRLYRHFEQYPRGLADVAGYWAESKIFGGIVVFDRGETETECKSIWIHGELVKGPKTLYPPTEEQFDNLVKFLTSFPNEDSTCPFPIHGTSVNRPRWDAYDAFTHQHIFRDKYERKLPSKPPRRGCVDNSVDWPELEDQRILMLAHITTPEGEPYNSEEEVAAARKRTRNITSSSPLRYSAGDSLRPS
ncbi:hypothetical protein BKA59DRAFT_174148 [Fusarium tricinctum]|uniref:Uncharacterized protein n=1 Tax=Fusarium tricinctum TaxID=61284 RepID=A0A8K0RXB5_9HYPO|nr:hypothetical protein BKA59DRAFT_174148 [Fusarium tricinctum]